MPEKPWSEPRSRADTSPYYAFLGRAIKVERTARGMDRKVLAERSGISYPYLSEIENGSKRPSSQAVLAIADALGMGPSELMAVAEELQESQGQRGPALRRRTDPAMPASFHTPAVAAESMSDWRPASRTGRDERAELIERIRLLVAALDLDDLVRVSDLIDRLRR